jgi:xanthine dehydrogenase accessory factor
MNDLNIYEEIVRLTREGKPFALATVIESSGSSPRKPGAKMLVRVDGSTLGTVGGGRVEAETVKAAGSALKDGVARTLPFVLNEEHGFACGGAMTVYVEPRGSAPHMVMFGAGHVGKATASLAKSCGFLVTVIDERPECANREEISCADQLLCCGVGEAYNRLQLDANCYVVIATPGHVSDFDAVRGAIRSEAGFIGLLGSRKKRETLLKMLSDEGIPEAQRARVVTPVGVSIGAETPQEIAVSIVGQLIQERKKNDSQRSGDPAGCRAVPAHGELQTASPA